MIVVKGGVTTAEGFLANGIKAGIKKSGKHDLALLYSEVPAVAAAAFTTNVFQASPIKISKKHLANSIHQAVVVNSGNANCGNGKTGDRDALLMADCTAKNLDLKTKEVLVASTGIIGRRLPIKNIKDNIPGLVMGLSREGGGLFSEAILTTDTKKKEFALKVRLGPSVVTIGGCSKGVGMIHPVIAVGRHPSASLRMVPSERKRVEGHATMLCFITTDAAITRRMLEEALTEAVEDSFNMVSVDGDTSTNDSCFILANGLAGNRRISAKDGYYHKFAEGLKFLTIELAKMLVRDGEGATKFVEIEVAGAATRPDAAKMARRISMSNLLKCCIYGGDPNWGRIAAACGSSGVKFDPNKLDIYLGDLKVLSGGAVVKNYDIDKARSLFQKKEISIKVDLKSGKGRAAAWTCDLSKEYVGINSEYST